MTAVITPESLDWVTFSGEDDERCDGRLGRPCGLEAVARAIWDASCDCCINPQRLCASHRDTVLADRQISAGFFRCWWCETRIFLLRIEPLR